MYIYIYMYIYIHVCVCIGLTRYCQPLVCLGIATGWARRRNRDLDQHGRPRNRPSPYLFFSFLHIIQLTQRLGDEHKNCSTLLHSCQLFSSSFSIGGARGCHHDFDKHGRLRNRHSLCNSFLILHRRLIIQRGHEL